MDACRDIALLLFLFCIITPALTATEHQYNPCCSLPCENNGICYSKGFQDYICDCTKTGYNGRRCETAELYTKIVKFLKPSKDTLQHIFTNYKFIWNIVNRIYWLRKLFMKMVLKIRTEIVMEPSPYAGFDDYTTWTTYTNKSVYARTLPPVPKNCPTPMGVKGKKLLPNPDEIVKRFFLRRKFIPCPKRSNLIFPFFAQHFTHQFFKADPRKGMPFQWGNQAVDLAHIYGDTYERIHALRSHEDGKMKVSVMNGETFPPLLEDAFDAEMFASEILLKKHQFAFGHRGFSPMPSFLLFSTLWIREHNRVCDIMKEEHPEWDDEQIFQTTRLILTAETIKIVIEDYVQHLSGFHFNVLYDPDIMAKEGFSYHNQVHVEFDTLYRWHSLVPDVIRLKETNYPIKDLLFNPGPMIDAGIGGLLKDLNTQYAGQVAGGKNQGSATLAVATYVINAGRKLRLQPFNKYRTRIGLKQYKSFTEFTGEKVMAGELEEAYGDIDALELYVGLILEKRRPKQLFGETITEMGSPYSLKGLYGNPVSSPGWWKAVTFGGERGFNIIKETNLQTLICRNVKGCPTISFEVPPGIEYQEMVTRQTGEDNSAGVMFSLARKPEFLQKYRSSHKLRVEENPNLYNFPDANVSRPLHNVKTEL